MSDSYLRVTIAGRERIDWRIFFGFFPPPSKTLRSPSCRYPLLFAVPDLSMLLDQAKSTRNSVRRKTSDRFFGKYPLTFDSVFPARSRFTTFWHQKVAPKVSAGRKSRGTADGLRLKRYADELAPAFSTAQQPPVLLPDFPQCGVCCALRATMIYCDLNSSLLI